MTTLIETHITDAENKIRQYVSDCIKRAFGKDDKVIIHVEDVDVVQKEVTFSFEIIKSRLSQTSMNVTKGFAFFDELAQGQQSAIDAILEIDTTEVPF